MKFIHKKANIEGQVIIGDNVSIWPFASIRGDEGQISIGNNTNIQDNATVHGKIVIGENVTIGHGAVVHGAKIGNNVLIGMNSTILEGVEIGDWCIIAAGSLISPNTKIESESLVMGSPGKIVRQIDEKDKELIKSSYKNYFDKIKK